MTTPTPRDRTNEHPYLNTSPIALVMAQLEGTFYTITETSKITGIPVSTLRRWYRTSETKAPSKEVHNGKQKIYLYTPEDLEELKQHRTPPPVKDRT